MFTGIIETNGIIREVTSRGTNKTFIIQSSISGQLKVDQSVAHDGACLTVESVDGDQHSVTAIEETLQKTILDSWKIGTVVNLERCLQFQGRIDGHMVQGHVDGTATCIEKTDLEGSWLYRFRFDPVHAALLIEKGSITIQGISLTVFNLTHDTFSVAIIPYTYEHTNIRNIQPGDAVNLEFDLIGKYMQRFIQLQIPRQNG